jgi:hypothetical protein
MAKTKKAPLPTTEQTMWLRRIAQSPMMKTYDSSLKLHHYSLQDGSAVPSRTAEVLIRNGWVKPRCDGLFNGTQTYDVLRP